MIRFPCCAKRTLLVALLFLTSGAFASDIIKWRVVTEGASEILLEIEYTYSGEFGENVSLHAYAASSGKPRDTFYFRPARAMRGTHVARVTLGTAESASTNQLRLGIHVDDGYKILDELFTYKKTWSAPADLAITDLTLDPMPMIQPVSASIVVTNKGGTSSGSFEVSWWPGENFPKPVTSLVSGLGPGEKKTLVLNYTGYASWYASLVTRVVVDPKHSVRDTDSTNNEVRRKIEVRRK
jgi:CARDB